MIIRALEHKDIEGLNEIHERHYSREFPSPDFMDKYICAFVVVNDSGKIISGGGIRTILESVILTDKDLPIKERRDALLEVLKASIFIAKDAKYDCIHAFSTELPWLRHLIKIGFKKAKGEALVLEV